MGILGVDGFHVRYLFIKTAFQHKGIGRLAIEWVQSYLVKNNISAIITLFASPNAAEAYQKMGFIKTGDEFVINGLRAIPYQMSIKNSLHC